MQQLRTGFIYLLCLVFNLQFLIAMACVMIYYVVSIVLHSLRKQEKTIYINPLKYAHPDVFKKSLQMVESQGFYIKEYHFKSEDDCTVIIWRLFNSNKASNQKFPIFLQHGLLVTGSSWFFHQDKKKSLPYLLSEEGFDIWIGNSRGTKFTVEQNPTDKYWDYSMDELAKYDVPLIVDEILRETGLEKIIYIGHSQGTTQLFLSLLQNQQLSSKIQKFIGLGPIISLNDVDNRIINILSKYSLIEFYKWIGYKKLLHIPVWMNQCVGILIYNTTFYYHICWYILHMLCGYTKQSNLDNNNFGVILSHMPGGTSTNNVLHWIQISRSKGFRKFDHGRLKNLKIYGSEEPPQYDFKQLKDIKFKKYLFRGTKDALAGDREFKELVKQLDADSTKYYQIEQYNHMDYVWGANAHAILYPEIIKICHQDSFS